MNVKIRQLVYLFYLTINFVVADTLYLRDGTVMEGTIRMESGSSYTLQQKNKPRQQIIPREKIALAAYDSPAKTEKVLQLNQLRKKLKTSNTTVDVPILPAKEFGNEIVREVKKAKKSIWITAYFISGSKAEPIKPFYDTLREKAMEGLDVVVVCEFGSGTPQPVKNTSMNYAPTLIQDGVKVLFLQKNMVLHKKLIIVDKKTVFLGSSNLTVAGTLANNEMNVKVEEPTFVQAAIDDFKEIYRKSKPKNKLNYQ